MRAEYNSEAFKEMWDELTEKYGEDIGISHLGDGLHQIEYDCNDLSLVDEIAAIVEGYGFEAEGMWTWFRRYEGSEGDALVGFRYYGDPL